MSVSETIKKLLGLPHIGDLNEFWFFNTEVEHKFALLRTNNDDWESLVCYVFTVSFLDDWQATLLKKYAYKDQQYESLMAINEIILEASIDRNAVWRPMLFLYPQFQKVIKEQLDIV